ncbi:hypothetical protein SIPHO049v1_p0003 [Vibrio phage PS14A.1]|nr:hypothetical protein SIPHO049v1_p0003 [Vibrio phage PS14A.1]
MSITKPLDLMGRLLKQEKIAAAVDKATGPRATVNAEKLELRKGELEHAIDCIEPLMPRAPIKLKLSVAGTVSAVMNRAVSVGTCYTPFQSTPEGAISYPKHMTDELRKLGARMPTTSEGDESYRPRHEVTLSAMAELSQLSKSTLASVNGSRQHLTVEGLNLWRIALVKIGKANPTITSVSALTVFEDPEEFLDELISDWKGLDSPLPVERIIEWGATYTKLSYDDVIVKVDAARPDITQYTKSLIKVWRDEYRLNALPNLTNCKTLLDIFKTKTSGRRLGRGFNEMIKAIHPDGASFNTRIKYGKTNFAAYKLRYESDRAETGLSSEVLMGYCVFLGINPIAILQWIADREASMPGIWDVERVYDDNSLLLWKGTISPRECLRFYEAIQQMGLVSDQNAWSLHLMHPSVIYRNLPTADSIMEHFNGDVYMDKAVAAYCKDSPRPPAEVTEWADYRGEHNTLYGKARASNALNPYSSVLIAVYGAASLKGVGAEEAVEELNMITSEEEFLEKGLATLVKSSRYDTSYIDLEHDAEGKIVPSKSYKSTYESNLHKVTVNFYRKVLIEFPERQG